MSNESPRAVVLVADDEEEMRTLIGRFVESQGYKVYTAADGDEAWDKAQKHQPDLVLLDVRMPGLSGWEVSRNIKHAASLAHTQVIMITGIGETINELTSPLFGAFAYLDKPFDLDDLEEKIQAALEASRAIKTGAPLVTNGVNGTPRAASDDDEAPAKAGAKKATAKKGFAPKSAKKTPEAPPSPAKSAKSKNAPTPSPAKSAKKAVKASPPPAKSAKKAAKASPSPAKSAKSKKAAPAAPARSAKPAKASGGAAARAAKSSNGSRPKAAKAAKNGSGAKAKAAKPAKASASAKAPAKKSKAPAKASKAASKRA